jgi:hypothetical protein
MQSFEWEWDYSPAWRYVGQHMRWAKPLQDVADRYIRSTIGVPKDEPIPHVSCERQKNSLVSDITVISSLLAFTFATTISPIGVRVMH